MITELRNSLRLPRPRQVEVCETCASACDATCRAEARRAVAVDRWLAAGSWR